MPLITPRGVAIAAVSEKPCRLGENAVKNHIASMQQMAPAGDVAPHLMLGTKRVSVQKSDVNGCSTRGIYAPAKKEADPLSVDAKRHEVRRMLQEMMSSYRADVDSLARRPDRPGQLNMQAPVPSTTAVEGLRYHTASRMREAPTPKEDSYHARQATRFHSAPNSKNTALKRSLTPEIGSFRHTSAVLSTGTASQPCESLDGSISSARLAQPDSYSTLFHSVPASNAGTSIPGWGSAAGRGSDSRLRHDTPGGKEASLGRTRSLTPDYYRRYSDNLAGSSLPGSTAAAATCGPPTTPRSARRVSACDPRMGPLTASSENKQTCRYHESEALLKLSKNAAHRNAKKSQASRLTQN